MTLKEEIREKINKKLKVLKELRDRKRSLKTQSRCKLSSITDPKIKMKKVDKKIRKEEVELRKLKEKFSTMQNLEDLIP